MTQRARPLLLSLSVGLGLGALPLGALAQSPPPVAAPAEGALPAVAPAADPAAQFASYVAQAQKLAQEQRKREALAVWQLAYQQRQEPALILEIARLEHQLGLGAEAISSYRRYLIAEPNPPTALRLEAEQAIARIRAFLPQPEAPLGGRMAPELFPVRVEKQPHHTGLIGGGWAMLSVGYAFAFGTGIGMGMVWGSSSCSTYSSYCSSPSSAGGYTLLIPVIGPLISSIVTPVTSREAATWGLVWDLPWLLTDLPLQVIGLALIIKGYYTPRYVLAPNILSSIQVRPYSSPNGSGLVALGRF